MGFLSPIVDMGVRNKTIIGLKSNTQIILEYDK